MSELRRDPVLGRWVIVRTMEPWTPDHYEKEDNSVKYAQASPFSEYRESMTPPEVEAIRAPGSSPNAPGWQVRVVPNKFPALKIEGDLDRHGMGIFDMSNGIGAHEVLIETPDPAKQMADFTPEEIKNVLWMYQRRSLDLAKDKRFQYIVVFKNFGRSAGASVEHAHSQIIALPMIPKYVQEKLVSAREYFQYRGRSIFSDILLQEREEKNRIVTENDQYMAFCPFVSRYSFEISLFPKKEQTRFVHLKEDELQSLGQILLDVLRRLRTCLGNPSFNFYLHVHPIHYAHEETFMWHMEIVPKLTRSTVFEWGTGFHVVFTPPEVAAKYLREAV